jgi:O-antigen/teichoic acid export membrane protein
MILIPSIAVSIKNETVEKVNDYLKHIFEFLILISIPFLFIVFTMTDEIIIIYAGVDYIDASTSLRILMVSYIFSIIGGSFLGNLIYLNTNKDKIYIKIALILSVINILMNAIFIPLLGIDGAALSTMISSIIMVIILEKNKQKNIKYGLSYKSISNIIFSSLVIFPIYFIYDLFIVNLFFKLTFVMITFSFIYVFLLYLSKNNFIVDIINKIFQRETNHDY